jgi:hypothetical protein
MPFFDTGMPFIGFAKAQGACKALGMQYIRALPVLERALDLGIT